MVEPLTAAVIVSLFFSEAIKEGGKTLTKGVADTFAQLVNTIREKFRAEGTEGLLTRAQNQPTEANKTKLQDELQTQIDADEAFANKLKVLVQQLQAQDERISQVVLSEIELSGDLKVKDISQKATRSSAVDQEMLKGVKATNIDVGNLNQEVTIQLPDDIAAQLQESGMDLPRVALEKIAIEGARSGELTDDQIRRLLGFETRMQVDAFLKSAGVYFDYTESDFAMDKETIEHLQTL